MNNNKTLVYRAGTIPYIVEDGEIKMMFMRPSNTEYGGDSFQCAKGRVEDGESTESAALREAKEELGLFFGNVSLIKEIGTFLGRTTVYIAKVKDKTLFGEPSFETEEVAWMTLQEFLIAGRELHRPMVQECHREICKIEKLATFQEN